MNRQELLQQIEEAHQELVQPGVVAPVESSVSESAKRYLVSKPVQISAGLELYPLKNPDCVAHPLIDGWYLIENGCDDYVFVSTSSGYVLISHSPPAYVVATVTI